MMTAERQYRQKVGKGKMISTPLNTNKDLSEESLTDEHQRALKLYRQIQLQHMSVYENASLKPWQKEVLRFIEHPSHREFIWVVCQKGGEGKTFLQNCIKYYYSDRRVIITDIVTNTKNLAHFLTKYPLECKGVGWGWGWLVGGGVGVGVVGGGWGGGGGGGVGGRCWWPLKHALFFTVLACQTISPEKYSKAQWYNKTVLLRDTVHQISRGESVAAGLTAGDVKNTKFNQYLPVSRFRAAQSRDKSYVLD